MYDKLTAFGENLWLDTTAIRILGTRLSATMALVRLRDGGLLLYSPLPMTPARRAEVDALGPVKHLYAPNRYHHLSIGDWAKAYPDARVHAPSKLARKRRDLRIDRAHDLESEPAFGEELAEVHINGYWLSEGVLVHRPTGTLIVADLVHNIGRPAHLWTKVYTWIAGFYDRIAISRVIRWLGFPNRKAARQSIDTVLALPFDRVILGHGAALESGGHAAIKAAYSWLP